MPFTSSPLRILLVAKDDDQTHLMRAVIAASKTPRFEVVYASNGWEAQRRAASGVYDAVVLDCGLSDADSETLLRRLKAMGPGAPALLLTSPGWDEAVAGADEYLPKTEGLNGNALVRAIVAMIQRRNLTEELATAREQAARATAVLKELAHDLATPLGVVIGMTQVLLSDDYGLNADGRSCLVDVAREALRASEILKRLSHFEPGASPLPSPVTYLRDSSPATKSGLSPKIVLIADDDPATRRLVSATLTSDQYTVLKAADGKEAWRLIRQHHPAVAILDWQMPIYSGLELTEAIKSDPQVRGTTVIMLTGRSTEADREAGARACADLYLIKPFSPLELLGAIEQALGID